MDEKYIQALHSQLGGESVFGKYEDFKDLIASDSQYAKNFYNNFGQDVLGAEQDFYSLVKKKDIGVSTSGTTSSVSSPKNPSTYNKGIESRDWQRHQELTRTIQDAAQKNDALTIKNASKQLEQLRASNPNIASDPLLNEDLQTANKIIQKNIPTVSLQPTGAATQKPVEPVRLDLKPKAPIPTQERINKLDALDRSLQSDIQLDDEDIKNLFVKDNIQLGFSEEGKQKLAEAEDQLNKEFGEGTFTDKIAGLYNSFLKNANVANLLPMAETGRDKALIKATAMYAKQNPNGKANEEEILQMAKDIRRKELEGKAIDGLVEDFVGDNQRGLTEGYAKWWALNTGQPYMPEDENQAEQIRATLSSVVNKTKAQEASFKSKALELQGLTNELGAYGKDLNNLTPEQAQAYKETYDKATAINTDLLDNYKNIDNDVNNLGDFQNELDLFKRNYNTLLNLSAKVGASGVRLTTGLMGAAQMVGKYAPGVSVDYANTDKIKFLDDMASSIEGAVERRKSIDEINSVGDFFKVSGGVMAEQLPQLFINASTGGSVWGLGLLAASATGTKYNEIKDKKNFTESQKIIASLAVGAFEYVSEKIESNMLKNALPSYRVMSAAANGATKLELDAMRAELKGGLKNAAKRTIENVAEIGLSANQEGISEVVAQVGGNLVDRYVLNNKNVNVFDGLKDAYLTGAIMGGVITASPIIGAKIVAPFVSDESGELRKNTKKINELTNNLSEIKDEKTKEIISNSIEKLKKKNEAIIYGGVNVINNLTPEEIREGSDNYQELQQIKDQYIIIKNNKEMSDASKKAVMEPLNERYNELVTKRKQLIDKANAIQKQGSGKVPVQPKTGVSQEVEQGKPQAKPQVVAEEVSQEVTDLRAKEQEEFLKAIPNIETFRVNGEIDKTNMTPKERAKYDKIYNKYDKLISPLLAEKPVQAKEEEVKQYVADLQETKQSNPEQYWSVDSVTEEAAKEGTVITDEDGGIVVSKDGDIKGLFKRVTSKAKGVAQRLIQKAVEAGGVKLDNFDNYLTPLYKKAGFRVVSRVAFNEEYAPEGWNKEKHGTPDVVAMVYDPQNKLDIQEQKFEDYDEAMAYRDQFVEQSKTEYPVQSNFDQALNKSAEALNVVAPGLKVIVGENIEDVQNQIIEAITPLIGERQAKQVAKEFATGTKGQTIFVDGKPFAVVFDKTTADSRTIGHEAWEVMLNDAFGNDQAKFKEFTDGIDAQLREQGFDDIADALNAFASQKGYENVKYSEYMAELGGMLVESGFGKGPLTAQQKTLLQKIGDIINKFAELFTGKKQFLDQATPEDILGFMVTISEKVAKGEDVSSFFRKGKKAKANEGVTSRKQAENIFTGKEKVPTFKSLPEIANWLEDWSKKNKIFAKDIKEVSDEEFVKKLESHTLKELAAWDGVRGQDYVSFYVGDIIDRLNPKLQKFAEARYGRMLTPAEVTLYHTVSGFASPQADPMFDSSKGLEIFDKYMNGGNPDINKLSGYADKQATIYALNDKGKKVDTGKLKFDKEGNPVYSQVSMHYAVTSLNKTKALISHFKGDVTKAMEWMTSIHSYEEISDVMGTPLKGSKAITPHENLSKENGGFGIFGFTGAKLGSYILNRVGEYSTVTKDMWYARTMARLVGDPLTKDGKAMTDPWAANTVAGAKKRKLADQAWESVAKKLNITPSDVQERMWDFEKRLYEKMGALEKASYASEGFMKTAKKLEPGLDLETKVVESRSQKDVPAVVDEVLTDDGKGNYLFVHYSDEKRDVIRPMSGSNKNFTSREEVSAISSVGGLAMYYTKAGQKENGVGDVAHTILVPKDKVYFYGTTDKGTVSHDPKGFEEEAIRRFQDYKNRGNEKNPTKYAFDGNNAAAWVTKVAGENGYDMLVTNWGAAKSYRAQTTKRLKPEAEYTGFKKVEDDVFEVGDEIFLRGSYAKVTDVNGSIVRYEGTNQYGGAVSGVFDINRSNAIMIEKAKPVVTVRAQKKDTYTNEEYATMSRNGVIFHAGKEDILILDPSKIKGGFRAVYGWGVYFAGTINKASDYGNMITFLNSKTLNFIRITDPVTEDLISKLDKIKDQNIYYDFFLDKLKKMMGVQINEARLRMGDFIRWDYYELWSKMFMDAGYDGFNQVDSEYVVFNMKKANEEILENPLKVTTRAQRVDVKVIPGYDRMMNNAEGIMDKTMNARNGSYNKATANAIDYIQKSLAYINADDIQRNQIIRDFNEMRGEKLKKAPSVNKILGKIKDITKVTVNEAVALKDQIKLEVKAAKDAVKYINELRKNLAAEIKDIEKRGKINARQAGAIVNKLNNVNFENTIHVRKFVDYMTKVFKDAEYADKLDTATSFKSKILKSLRNPKNQVSVSTVAKRFSEINPAMVDNIDEYISEANKVLSSLVAKASQGGIRTAADFVSTETYINSALKDQLKKEKQQTLEDYDFLVTAGVIDDSMSLDEINQVIESVEESEDDKKGYPEILRDYLESQADSLSSIAQKIITTGIDPLTNTIIDLTETQKGIIKKLIGVADNFESMKLPDIKQTVEYLQNFIANGITDGVEGFVEKQIGAEGAKELYKKFIKTRTIKRYFSSTLGEIQAKGLSYLHPLIESMFHGQTGDSVFSNSSGIYKIEKGVNEANSEIEKTTKEYLKEFGNKDFFDVENIYERGILALLYRNDGSENYFEDQKSLIQQSIDEMLSSKDVNEVKKGEIAQKVFDKLIKDAKNGQEAFDNAKQENRRALLWWVTNWDNHYPALEEVSRNVYNDNLSKEENYTSKVYKKINQSLKEDVDLLNNLSAYRISTGDYTVKSKSGALIKTTRNSKLPENRILSFDFDINQMRVLKSALVDAKTAGPIRKIEGFINSPYFMKLGPKEDMQLLKGRINRWVALERGKDFVEKNELSKIAEFINKLNSLGAARALFSIAQIPSQTIPVAYNTLINSGGKVAFLNEDMNYFIDNSGSAVANRGSESIGVSLSSVNKLIEEASKSKPEKFLKQLNSLNQAGLKRTLANPDRSVARSSFISYYAQKVGKKISEIDWKEEAKNPKQYAINYADQMVNRQQTGSNPNQAGDWFTSKDARAQIFKSLMLPLATFSMNQKIRMQNDLVVLFNKMSSTEDKSLAARSLFGLVNEMSSYLTIRAAIGYGLTYASVLLMSLDDDEEEKILKKKTDNIIKNSITSASTDLLAPIPLFNTAVVDLVNIGLSQYYGIKNEGKEELTDKQKEKRKEDIKWYKDNGIELPENYKTPLAEEAFQLYSAENIDQTALMGSGGIAISKIEQAAEFEYAATTGKILDKSYGKTRIKYLLPQDQKVLQQWAVAPVLYNLGLLPAEFNNIANNLMKIAKGRALTEKQMEKKKADDKWYKDNGVTPPKD